MTQITETGCQCGCNITTEVTNANEVCGCGCGCCSDPPKTVEDEIDELHTLRARIESRLAELDRA